VPNGDNVLDRCGVCDADATNDCRQDCDGTWGGAAAVDLEAFVRGSATIAGYVSADQFLGAVTVSARGGHGASRPIQLLDAPVKLLRYRQRLSIGVRAPGSTDDYFNVTAQTRMPVVRTAWRSAMAGAISRSGGRMVAPVRWDDVDITDVIEIVYETFNQWVELRYVIEAEQDISYVFRNKSFANDLTASIVRELQAARLLGIFPGMDLLWCTEPSAVGVLDYAVTARLPCNHSAFSNLCRHHDPFALNVTAAAVVSEPWVTCDQDNGPLVRERLVGLQEWLLYSPCLGVIQELAAADLDCRVQWSELFQYQVEQALVSTFGAADADLNVTGYTGVDNYALNRLWPFSATVGRPISTASDRQSVTPFIFQTDGNISKRLAPYWKFWTAQGNCTDANGTLIATATDATNCTVLQTGNTWMPSVCTTRSNVKLSVVDKQSCLIVPTGNSWVPPSCTDTNGAAVAANDEDACRVLYGIPTGNTWTAGVCSNASQAILFATNEANCTARPTGNTWRSSACYDFTNSSVHATDETECTIRLTGNTWTMIGVDDSLPTQLVNAVNLHSGSAIQNVTAEDTQLNVHFRTGASILHEIDYCVYAPMWLDPVLLTFYSYRVLQRLGNALLLSNELQTFQHVEFDPNFGIQAESEPQPNQPGLFGRYSEPRVRLQSRVVMGGFITEEQFLATVVAVGEVNASDVEILQWKSSVRGSITLPGAAAGAISDWCPQTCYSRCSGNAIDMQVRVTPATNRARVQTSNGCECREVSIRADNTSFVGCSERFRECAVLPGCSASRRMNGTTTEWDDCTPIESPQGACSGAGHVTAVSCHNHGNCSDGRSNVTKDSCVHTGVCSDGSIGIQRAHCVDALCVEDRTIPSQFECQILKGYTWLPAGTYSFSPYSWSPFAFTPIVQVHVRTTGFGNEVRWRIDGGPEYGPYHNHGDFYHDVQLLPGNRTFWALDSRGDGWHGGFFELRMGPWQLVPPTRVTGAVTRLNFSMPSGPNDGSWEGTSPGHPWKVSAPTRPWVDSTGRTCLDYLRQGFCGAVVNGLVVPTSGATQVWHNSQPALSTYATAGEFISHGSEDLIDAGMICCECGGGYNLSSGLCEERVQHDTTYLPIHVRRGYVESEIDAVYNPVVVSWPTVHTTVFAEPLRIGCRILRTASHEICAQVAGFTACGDGSCLPFRNQCPWNEYVGDAPVSVSEMRRGCPCMDRCMVCSGNDSCVDCALAVYGKASVDHCGTCHAPNDGSCVEDCRGVWGGSFVVDGCGVCGGGNISCTDCAGIFKGTSRIDQCGRCDAISTNDCRPDCTGTWGGHVVDDICGVCGGDGTSCVDCLGILNGPNVRDRCGHCDANPFSDCLSDCAGVWGGNNTADRCGACSGPEDACFDCNNTRNGPATVDDCGRCVNPYQNDVLPACYPDCSGVAKLANDTFRLHYDLCGVCGGNGTLCLDCLGVANGTAKRDRCGTCDLNATNDCKQDCHGVWGGAAALDLCSVCGGANALCADCAGIPNGPALLDNCSRCDANPANDCVRDCSGTWGGILVVDRCGVCGGNDACADCAGHIYGNASLDACQVCSGDNSSCADACGVPNGDNSSCIDGCGMPNGDNSTCADCTGVPNGNLTIDMCGVCGGKNLTCAGCDNVPHSGLVSDACGHCGGDNSSCTDCGGELFGLRSLDQCGACDALAWNDCPADCFGVWGGAAGIDFCGVCAGDNSTCIDCNNVPDGDSVVDQCGACDNDFRNDCEIDCAGVWGGTATATDCGVCGGNASLCADCAGVEYGTARVDHCGVCHTHRDGECRLDCTGTWGGTTALGPCGICGGTETQCSRVTVLWTASMSIEGRAGISAFSAGLYDALGTHIVQPGNYTLWPSSIQYTTIITVQVFGALRNFATTGGSVFDSLLGAQVQLQFREGLATLISQPLANVHIAEITDVRRRRRQLSTGSWVSVQYVVTSTIDIYDLVAAVNFHRRLAQTINTAGTAIPAITEDARGLVLMSIEVSTSLNFTVDIWEGNRQRLWALVDWLRTNTTVAKSIAAYSGADPACAPVGFVSCGSTGLHSCVPPSTLRCPEQQSPGMPPVGVHNLTVQEHIRAGLDCFGITTGSATYDVCGVCGGTGQACLDCAGAVYGNSTLDHCGKCDSNSTNDCEMDCAGVWGGTASSNLCGVCAGDDISVCFLWGCDGVRSSDTIVDRCGVCGGNGSSCADCSGIPFGNKRLDNCGSCDADISNDCTLDCAGIWGGHAALDTCAVCNGDGTACLNATVQFVANIIIETPQSYANKGHDFLRGSWSDGLPSTFRSALGSDDVTAAVAIVNASLDPDPSKPVLNWRMDIDFKQSVFFDMRLPGTSSPSVSEFYYGSDNEVGALAQSYFLNGLSNVTDLPVSTLKIVSIADDFSDLSDSEYFNWVIVRFEALSTVDVSDKLRDRKKLAGLREAIHAAQARLHPNGTQLPGVDHMTTSDPVVQNSVAVSLRSILPCDRYDPSVFCHWTRADIATAPHMAALGPTYTGVPNGKAFGAQFSHSNPWLVCADNVDLRATWGTSDSCDAAVQNLRAAGLNCSDSWLDVYLWQLRRAMAALLHVKIGNVTATAQGTSSVDHMLVDATITLASSTDADRLTLLYGGDRYTCSHAVGFIQCSDGSCVPSACRCPIPATVCAHISGFVLCRDSCVPSNTHCRVATTWVQELGNHINGDGLAIPWVQEPGMMTYPRSTYSVEYAASNFPCSSATGTRSYMMQLLGNLGNTNRLKAAAESVGAVFDEVLLTHNYPVGNVSQRYCGLFFSASVIGSVTENQFRRVVYSLSGIASIDDIVNTHFLVVSELTVALPPAASGLVSDWCPKSCYPCSDNDVSLHLSSPSRMPAVANETAVNETRYDVCGGDQLSYGGRINASGILFGHISTARTRCDRTIEFPQDAARRQLYKIQLELMRFVMPDTRGAGGSGVYSDGQRVSGNDYVYVYSKSTAGQWSETLRWSFLDGAAWQGSVSFYTSGAFWVRFETNNDDVRTREFEARVTYPPPPPPPPLLARYSPFHEIPFETNPASTTWSPSVLTIKDAGVLTIDCHGIPGGGAVLDACAVCGGYNDTCADCAGQPYGTFLADNCGTCDANTTNDCGIDCAGIWGGNATIDLCGVCAGDNSLCSDCANVPYGNARVDQCGHCDDIVTNDCVRDCATVWGGGLDIDACGWCGGHNASCSDCAAVPNGNATFDNCGTCDNIATNDCVRDCTGVWGGPERVDICGVCGGNAVCAGCDGVANSGVVPDRCMICGGNNSCVGCDNVTYSGLVDDDVCGLCGSGVQIMHFFGPPQDGLVGIPTGAQTEITSVEDCAHKCLAALGQNCTALVFDTSYQCHFAVPGIAKGSLPRYFSLRRLQYEELPTGPGAPPGIRWPGCAGCDAVPRSGLQFDACHVCDGDNSTCQGCDGIPNSGMVLDTCSVCGGNNATCRFKSYPLNCISTQYEMVAPVNNCSGTGSAVYTWCATDRQCANLTECTTREYEMQPATAISDRRCTPLSDECGDTLKYGKYMAAPSTRTSDRVCRNVTICALSEWESFPPTVTSDRVCLPVPNCATDEYEATPATSTSPNMCVQLTQCTASQYESNAPTKASDRNCTMLTVCTRDQFARVLATATSDNQCQDLTTCTSREMEVRSPTVASDRVCASTICEMQRHGEGQGNFSFLWSFPTVDEIEIAYEIPGSAYVGIGLGNTIMANTDMVIGWVNADASVYIGDFYSVGNVKPLEDAQLDLYNVSAQYQDGRTCIGFRRKLFSRDTRDANIEVGPLSIIYSWGGAVLRPPRAPHLIYHTREQRQSVTGELDLSDCWYYSHFGISPPTPPEQECKVHQNPCDQQYASCRHRNGVSTCSCHAGYTSADGGITCTDVNHCATVQCQNNAVCVDGLLSYTCQCALGYTGQLCEVDVNECISSPCANGGVCTDAVNQYICACTNGWSGSSCMLDVDECGSAPCEHSGSTCVHGVGNYSCACESGYTGTNCATNIDECNNSAPCLNGGICYDSISRFTCACLSGFSGSVCNQVVDACLPSANPCDSLYASCANLDAGAVVCTCHPGFSSLNNGTNCTQIDECNSSPCLNGGVCADSVQAYTCGCPAGYRGDECEIDVDECGSLPCQHGSECLAGVNQYTCNCTAGWVGTNCAGDFNECTSSPCQQSGSICRDSINGFKCSCAAGA
jgi:hypothetical protein